MLGSNKSTVHVPSTMGKRNIFHRRLTQMCGTITPLWYKEVTPGWETTEKIAIGVTLPPLASDTYMRCEYKIEAFAVPIRLCLAGFENWFVNRQSLAYDSDLYQPFSDFLPYISVPILREVDPPTDKLHIRRSYCATPFGSEVEVDDRGTLLNYLGIKRGIIDEEQNNGGAYPLAAYPLVGYHLIYQHWYRQALVQNECFGCVQTNDYGDPASVFYAGILPSYHYSNQCVITATPANSESFLLADGCSLFQLRQRNYGYDYFANAFPTVSQPNISVPSVNSFTISDLRAANSLTQYLEMSQIAGNRLVDVCKTFYGANLKDGVAQRPIFLGSARYDIMTSGVTVTASNDTTESNNPFSDYAGGRVGNAFGSGSDFIIDHFMANEPMLLYVLGTLVPKATYGSGVPRYLMRYTKDGGSPSDRVDYPSAMLQNTGNEPIFAHELSYLAAWNRNTVFGYTEKYSDWVNDLSDAVGEFSANGSLHSFVLQRVFDRAPQVNSAFLEIHPTDMDDITFVDAAISRFGCMVDVDFDVRYRIPLYEESMPSLQNPAYEHGKAITVHRGGFRF